MFQVLDVRKVKTLVGLQNVLGHNSREIISKETKERLNPNWEKDWADIKDLHLLGKKYSQALDDRKKLCENLRRKVNKNASAGFEFVVSADRNLDRSKWRGYLYDAKAFFEKRFGAENFISFAIHLDETTPHAHFVVVPILIKDGKRAYSSSEFIKNPEALARLHTDFWRAVGSKYGLERGVEGHAVTHSDAKDFRRKVALQKAKEIELTEKERQVEDANRRADNRLKDAENREKAVANREKAVTDRENTVADREKSLQAEYEGFEYGFKKLVDDYKADRQKLDAEIKGWVNFRPEKSQARHEVEKIIYGSGNGSPEEFKKLKNWLPKMMREHDSFIYALKKTIRDLQNVTRDEPDIGLGY